MHAEA